MKKKMVIAAAVLSAALAFSLSGCSGGSSSSTSGSSSGSASASASASASSSTASEGEQAVLGTTYTKDYYEVTFKSADWLDEVSYSQTNGHFTSHPGEAQEGKTYLAITCDVKCTNSDAINAINFMSSKFAVDKYNYDGKVDSTEPRYSSTKIDPLETKEFVIFAAIPNELKDSSAISLTVNFSKDPTKTPSSTGNLGDVYVLNFTN